MQSHLSHLSTRARSVSIASRLWRQKTPPFPTTRATIAKRRQLHYRGVIQTSNHNSKIMASTPDREDSTRDGMFIARFYGDERAKDDHGRSLDQICAFSDRELEGCHNYVQTMFPLPERSGVILGAPIITREVRNAFHENDNLRKRLFRAFIRMANFYAFEVDGDESSPTLKPKANFERLASQTWLTQMDHNHLRITRIIRSLRVLGLEAVAQVFYTAVTDNAAGVSRRSIAYWTRAAKRPLYLPPDAADNSTDIIEWLKDDLQ